jgi:aromatic amino acid aminotransferase I
VHNPPYRDWGCTMSIGSTSSLEVAFRMFLNPGDCVLAEEFTFSSAVETSHPLGCRFVGVPMDDEGMIPSALDDLLSTWDPAVQNAPKPFLVYTVPTGQNPTGSTQSLSRRKAIYKLAQKHDLILLEDEPYYFLQMQPYTGPDAEPVPPPKNNDEFIRSIVPSLLSMDVDGRVVRLDSFSKVLAPGTRVGWVVASAQIIERYQRAAETSTQFPSGLSQIILHRLLDEKWGHAGYLAWLINLRLEYTQRRDILMGACEKYLPKEVANWTPPAAGMFHWINLKAEKHPKFGEMGLKEIEDETFKKAVEEKVLVVPGSFFLADKTVEMRRLFVRTTFAAAAAGDMVEAIRRLGKAIRREFGLPLLEEQE